MTPAQARQSLANLLDMVGENVVLRRLSGANPGDYTVRARIQDAKPSDDEWGSKRPAQQQRRKAIVSAEDVERVGFPVPFLPKQDRLVWNGKTLVITAIDDGTRRIQGVLIGYDLEITGG